MMLSDSLRFCLVVVLIFVKQGQAQDGSGDENTDFLSGSFDIDHAIAAIAGSASLMQIPNFHNYSYDDPNNMSIIDGGLGMYDTGNKIRLLVNASAATIQYGRTYRDETSVFSSIATHPFVALWWIEKSRTTKYVMEITSNFGSDGTGSSQTFRDEFVSGHAMVDVVGFQLYKAGSSLSVCEVFFVVKNVNPQMENSTARLLFHASPTTEEGGVHLGILTGEVFNQVLFGYTLLSKQGERIVTKSEIRATIKAIVESVFSQAEPTTTDLSFPDGGSSASDVTTPAVDAAVSQTDGLITSPHPKYSVTERTNRMREVLRSHDLSRQINGFHRYIYDSSIPTRISDGGSDMYDTGNSVYFTVNGVRTLAEYDRTYNGSGYTFSSVPLHPFAAFFVIDKEQSDPEPKNYSIQVISNLGADGSGSFDSENGTVTSGNYTLSYYTAQVYMAGDPSVCEVYFYIRQNQIPEDPNLKLNFTIPTREREEMKNYLNRTGSKEPGILGYMLLSKRSGLKVSTTDIRYLTSKLLDLLSQKTPYSRATDKIRQRLGSSNLTKHLPDFFTYVYDDTSFPINSISDGTNDMYDTGNRVYFGIEDGNLELAEYNETYRETDYSFSVLAIHPFIAFFYINTTNETYRNYTIKVSSNLGADGLGSYQNFSGSVSLGDYELSFHGAQVYGAQDASVCEVFFFISQDPSGKIFSFSSPYHDRLISRNTARLSGIINKAVFGYTLLSTPIPGRQITQNELEATMLTTLSAITGQEMPEVATMPTSSFNVITKPMESPHVTSISMEKNTTTSSILTSKMSGKTVYFLEQLRATDLTSHISYYHRYSYDADNNMISDGGHDMYDGGNKVYFTVNGMRTRAEYDRTYNGSTYSFSSVAGNPFAAFFLIDKIQDSAEPANYSIQVISNLGADGRGDFLREGDSISIGDLTLTYKVAQVAESGDASVCEVFFYVREDSSAILRFTTPVRDTRYMKNFVNLTANREPAILGYILLAQKYSRRVTTEEIRTSMTRLLQMMTVAARNTSVMASETTEQLLQRFRSSDLTRHVRNFHRYRYDDTAPPMSRISDGGDDMYDVGNMVHFAVNEVETLATYNQTYRGLDYSFSTLPIHPFIALFYINSSEGTNTNYSIRVTSNLGADGGGSFSNFSGIVSLAGYELSFEGVQVYGASDASVCEVFFHVSLSRSEETFSFSSPERDRRNIESRAVLSGNINQAVLGYMLLSTESPGPKIAQNELEATMLNTLSVIIAQENTTISTMAPEVSIQRGMHKQRIADVTYILLTRFRASNVTKNLPDFHRYVYDDTYHPINKISDGGNDMYDDGNKVYFAVDGNETLATYNETYNGSDYSFSTLAIHPFIAFFYINSTEPSNRAFSIRLSSNLGADGSGRFQKFSGSVSLRGYRLFFSGAQVYQAGGDASVCEVFFYFLKTQGGETFSFSSPEQGRTYLQSTAQLSGVNDEAIFGYTLLSTQSPGRQITQYELETTMLNTLSVILDQEPVTAAIITSSILQRFLSSNLTKHVSDFYRYEYDDRDLIFDGGSDMFDKGNKVYFSVDGNETRAAYNKTYNGTDYSFSTLAIHPFIAFFNINPNPPKMGNFSIRVASHRADRNGEKRSIFGSVSLGGYELVYRGFQLFGVEHDASVCEVFFYILKIEDERTFYYSTPNRDTERLDYEATLSGSFDHALMGYILLSTQSPGRQITTAELDATMLNIISVILDQEPYLNATNTTSVDSNAFTDDSNAELADVARIIQDRFRSADLGRHVKNFHPYRYDDSDAPNNSISDGGNDMYDGGNKVYFTVDGVKTHANYSQNYTGPGYIFSTLTSHPFLAFYAIMTNARDEKLFIIELESNLGADGDGVFQNFSGSLSLNGFFLEFKGVQVYGARDASVCEVYFHIGRQNENFGILELDSPQRYRYYIASTAKVHGHIGSGLFGYLLLSTLPERKISQVELEATMLNVLQIVSMETFGPSQNVTYINETVTSVDATDVAVTGQPVPKVPTAVSHRQSIADVTYILLTRFRASQVTKNLPDFHQYVYDDTYHPINKISDGGNDMYDDGNQVFFAVDGNETFAEYNKTYNGSDYSFSTLAIHPFIAFFYINSTEPSNKTFSIRVRSNLGADGSGRFQNFSGSVSFGGYQLFFSGAQVYRAGSDASVCEVFFYFLKTQGGETFSFSSPEQGRSNLRSTAQLSGVNDEAILGYTLLSTQSPGRQITDAELDATMLNIISVILDQEPYLNATNTNTTFTSVGPSAFTDDNNAELAHVARIFQDRFRSADLGRNIQNFYTYRYDDSYAPNNSISDGGNDMYDDGNKVYFTVDGVRTLANYSQNYTGPGYIFSTLTSHPFLAFYAIMTNARDEKLFFIEVESNLGADGGGVFQNFSGSQSLNGFFLEFKGVQVYDAGDASVCEVYFHIGRQNENFGILELDSPRRDRRYIHSTAKVHGRIGSGLFGYLLLSTLPEREITQDELGSTMLNVLQFVSMETFGPSQNVTYINETANAGDATDVDAAITALAEVTRTFQGRFRSANFARHIENFHPYQYDSASKRISSIYDGGSDMYDTGNEVYFYVDGIKTLAIYNQTYSGPGYTFSTLAVHPFIAFFTLATEPRNSTSFIIEVKSNLGADGRGSFRNFSGSQSLNGFFLEFKGVQVFGANDASVCEVYFYVRQQSYTLSTFELEFPEQDRQFLHNTAKVFGHSGSGMLGYVLISTEPDREITQNELEAVMLNVLQLVSVQVLDANSTIAIPEATQETAETSAKEGIVDTALRAISNGGPSIVSPVSSFHPYVYDGSSYNIADGGGDMYDGGNIVHFSSDGTNFTGPMIYNTTKVTGSYEIGIFAGHPFTALMWIKDTGLETRDFRLNVSGDAGVDGSGSIERFNNSISSGSTEVQYHVWQLHGSSDPTICEVYFIITDQRWGPTGHHQFEFLKYNPSKDRLQNSVRLSGTIRNMFFGYTLLSSARGKVSRSQVTTVLNEMMTVITTAVEPLLVRPTQQLDADAIFLPSCTAKVAVNSIFRCDAIFRKPAKRYTGPDICRSVMDQLFRCVAFQMYQCHHGGEENYFDTLVPSCFNSEVMITYLRNLPNARKHDRNNFVDTFCHHAANKLEYPFELPYLTDLCEAGVINELVSEAGKFMYVYLWSKDATDVCPAFQTLRSWFVSTMRNRCSFRLSSRVRARKTRQYLNQLIEVVIAAVDEIESTICTSYTQPEMLVIQEFEELMLGGKQSQPRNEGGSQKRRRSQRTN